MLLCVLCTVPDLLAAVAIANDALHSARHVFERMCTGAGVVLRRIAMVLYATPLGLTLFVEGECSLVEELGRSARVWEERKESDSP